MITAKKYYDGNNVTINEVKKQIYVKRTCKKSDGTTEVRNILENNPFVSNYHITDSFVQDMIDQKVYTLLDRMPTLEGVGANTEKVLKSTMDYALQRLGVECSLCSVAYGYVEINKGKYNIKPFASENCIAFVDPVTDDLGALIRFWKSTNLINSVSKTYAEVYEKDTYTLYESVGAVGYKLVRKQGYFTEIKKDAISEVTTSRGWESGIPIIRMRNNGRYKSDFSQAIRSKIDAIDIVTSDFANNLSDFQDIFWVLKGMDAVSAEDFGEFISTIKQTLQAALPQDADISAHQVQIPHEAKTVFVKECKRWLVENAGVIDTSTMIGGSLTATAIKASMQKLMLRVSKFEYEAYNTAMEIIRFASEFAKEPLSNPNVRFYKAAISNDTEIIANLTSSLPNISLRTYLENHPYIEDVDQELERIAEEAASKYTIELQEQVTASE